MRYKYQSGIGIHFKKLRRGGRLGQQAESGDGGLLVLE